KGKIECSASCRGGFRPYLTLVFIDDAFYQRQSDSRTFKFFVTVQTLKHFEQLIRVFHVKTGPVITDIINSVRRTASITDLYKRLCIRGGGFERIPDQI